MKKIIITSSIIVSLLSCSKTQDTTPATTTKPTTPTQKVICVWYTLNGRRTLYTCGNFTSQDLNAMNLPDESATAVNDCSLCQ